MVKRWLTRRARKRREFEQDCQAAYARQQLARAWAADPTMGRVFRQVYAAMMMEPDGEPFKIPEWAAKEELWATRG